jgi:hypothetical protein
MWKVALLDERDTKKMIQLAREGKRISKIWEVDFPNYDYYEIYGEIVLAGEKSIMGVKRMITTRLKKIAAASDSKRDGLIDEVNNLVLYLYVRNKEHQKKLDEIRKVIGE